MAGIFPLPPDFKAVVFPFLANSIECAHRYAPNRWGLTPRTGDGWIRLNVVYTLVLTIATDRVTVIVNHAIAKDIPAVRSGDLLLESWKHEKSSPDSRVVFVEEGKHLKEFLWQLQEAHHENIRVTAQRKRAGGVGGGVKKAHSNEAILEIAREVGRKLPRPPYSYDGQVDDFQDDLSSSRMEGAKEIIFSSRFERDLKNREVAKKLHGVTCRACGFNFESFYGEHGAGYIHVHHLKPLSELGEQVSVDPQKDLDVVCANCHAMIHRDKTHTLSLDELKKMIAKQRDQKADTKPR